MSGYDYCESDMLNFVSYRNIEEKFTGEITWVESPSDFYVNIVHGKEWNIYLDLMDDMQKFYKTYKSKCYISKGCIGQLVAVKVDGRSKWLRGCIKNIVSRDRYDIFYIDTGYIQYDVDERDIRLLRYKFAAYCPAQAIPVKLAFVEPTKGYWSKSAVSLLKDYMDMELLMKCSSTKLTKDCGRFSIVLLDKRKYDDKYIVTPELVKGNYAEFTEASLMREMCDV